MSVIYVTGPKSVYASDQFSKAIVLAKELDPEAMIVDARTIYSSIEDCRVKWPNLKTKINLLIFVVDEKSYIGKGTFTEIMTMERLKVPVVMFYNESFIDSYSISSPCEDNWKQYAKVVVCEQ